MQKLNLKAQTREKTGKEVNQLRQQDLVPSVMYGHGAKNINLKVDAEELAKVYEEAGENTLVDLSIDDKKAFPVLIHDIQKDSVRGDIMHVDFYKIKAGEKITTEVELVFMGESKAVKEEGGILVKNFDSLKIECLPKDLIHQIEVDISALEDFDTSIHVNDLKIPETIHVLEDAERVVATVTLPREEEVIVETVEEDISEKPIAGKEEEQESEQEEKGVAENKKE